MKLSKSTPTLLIALVAGFSTLVGCDLQPCGDTNCPAGFYCDPERQECFENGYVWSSDATVPPDVQPDSDDTVDADVAADMDVSTDDGDNVDANLDAPTDTNAPDADAISDGDGSEDPDTSVPTDTPDADTDGEPSPFQWECETGEPVLSPETVVLDPEVESDWEVSGSPEGQVLTVSAAEVERLGVELGTVLVGGIGDVPVLARVLGLAIDSPGRYELATEPAELTDAFQELCVQIAAPSPSPIDLVFDAALRFDTSGEFDLGLDGWGTLDGDYHFGGGMSLGLEIRRARVERFEISGDIDVAFSSELSILIEGLVLEAEEDFDILNDIPITRGVVFAGPVPIYYEVEAEITLILAVEASAGISASVPVGFNAAGGFGLSKARGTAPQTSSTLTADQSGGPFTVELGGDAAASAAFGVELEVELYRTVEAGVVVGPVLELEGETAVGSGCEWDLTAGLGVWLSFGSALRAIDLSADIRLFTGLMRELAAGSCGCTSDASCEETQHCLPSGECVSDVCTADAIFCSGDEVQRCDSRGAGATVVETCDFGCTDDSCDAGTVCGDGLCESGESCPEDCDSFCGNSVCDAGEQTSCPSDCPAGPECGDERCDSGEATSCPEDCDAGPECGDDTCDATETSVSCPEDCGSDAPVLESVTCTSNVRGQAADCTFRGRNLVRNSGHPTAGLFLECYEFDPENVVFSGGSATVTGGWWHCDPDGVHRCDTADAAYRAPDDRRTELADAVATTRNEESCSPPAGRCPWNRDSGLYCGVLLGDGHEEDWLYRCVAGDPRNVTLEEACAGGCDIDGGGADECE